MFNGVCVCVRACRFTLHCVKVCLCVCVRAHLCMALCCKCHLHYKEMIKIHTSLLNLTPTELLSVLTLWRFGKPFGKKISYPVVFLMVSVLLYQRLGLSCSKNQRSWSRPLSKAWSWLGLDIGGLVPITTGWYEYKLLISHDFHRQQSPLLAGNGGKKKKTSSETKTAR